MSKTLNSTIQEAQSNSLELSRTSNPLHGEATDELPPDLRVADGAVRGVVHHVEELEGLADTKDHSGSKFDLRVRGEEKQELKL